MFSFRRVLPVACLVALALSPDAPARAEKDMRAFSLELENDRFAGTDRHYTHGTRLTWVSAENDVPGWADALFGAIPYFGSPGARHRVGYSLGQSIFAPEDIGATELVSDDRPYAGWSYGGAVLLAYDDSWLEALELEVGVVGPASLAEETQIFVHETIGAPRPRGWDNQLDNEPGVVLSYERRWRACLTAPGGYCGATPGDRLDIDITPHVGGSVGNVFSFLSLGGAMRVGSRLDAEFGPPRVRPGIPGWVLGHWDRRLSWHAFAGAEVRLVGRNIFLDGNTFSDSHSVSKTPLVGDFQIGFAVTLPNIPVMLTYRHVLRTPEFENQNDLDQFDAISISIIY